MSCINCNIDLHHSRRILVLEELDIRTISMIAEWIAPVIVTETDCICVQCWEAAMRAINESLNTMENASDSHPFEASSSNVNQPQRVIGHSRVCITCGRSVLRIPSELVVRTNPTARQQQIQLLISNNIAPRQVNPMDRLCHNCYRAAGCTVARMPHQTQIKKIRKTYYVYILTKTNLSGRSSILEYCCNCIVGRRTLGCCAHVMTVVWYLGWARYQDNILLPAQHLNNVFVEEE